MKQDISTGTVLTLPPLDLDQVEAWASGMRSAATQARTAADNAIILRFTLRNGHVGLDIFGCVADAKTPVESGSKEQNP